MSKNVLKDPLLHFVLIGACLFGLYAWVNPQAMQSDKQIVIDQGQINALSERFSRLWKRAPTEAELDALVEDFVIEEIYYREALALGIDRDDPVIRRRLRQKMEVYTDNLASTLQASEAQLNDYLQTHPDKFMADSRYSFTQVFISTDRSGDRLQDRLSQVQAALKAGEPVSGDPTLLPSQLENYTASQVNRAFGSGFSQQLDTLPLNQWSAPLPSGLGIHIVMLRERVDGSLPELETVRTRVEQEWRYARAQDLDQRLRENMLADYDVVIDAAGEVN